MVGKSVGSPRECAHLISMATSTMATTAKAATESRASGLTLGRRSGVREGSKLQTEWARSDVCS